jgi:hypothetical protein
MWILQRYPNTLNCDNDVLRFTIIFRLCFMLMNGYVRFVQSLGKIVELVILLWQHFPLGRKSFTLLNLCTNKNNNEEGISVNNNKEEYSIT